MFHPPRPLRAGGIHPPLNTKNEMLRIEHWGIVDAEAFLLYALRLIGPGYHPDTRFEQYQDGEGNPTFTEIEAAARYPAPSD